MKSRATNENGVVAEIVRAINREYPTAWFFKVHGGPYQEAGIPDLLGCVEGLLFGIEVKFQRPHESKEAARGRATPGQRRQIARINRAGGAAGVALNAEEALDIIRRAFEKQERRSSTDGSQHHRT